MPTTRRRLLTLTALGGAGLLSTAATGTPDVLTGDLIFHSSKSKQSSAIMWATKSMYSHCGIVRVYQNRRYVIEASATVRVTPWSTFTARGRLGRYAVFRDPRLTTQQRTRLWTAAKRYRGRSYDVNFLFGNRAIYCSELIYLGYQAVGVDIGQVETAGELDTDNPLTDYLLERRKARHPLCGKRMPVDDCKARLFAQNMITPDAIARDERLERVFSNYLPV